MEQTPEISISTAMVTGCETDGYDCCHQDLLQSCHHIHHHHHHIHHHHHHPHSLEIRGEEKKPITVDGSPSATPVDGSPSATLVVQFQTKKLYRIKCKSDPNFFLSVRDGEVILAPFNVEDESQLWYKDEKHFKLAKDEMGRPAFALVNRATKEAMKHSFGHSHPVQLITYNPYVLDESILWTQCKEDLGDGYHSIRMINNTDLSVDATAANIHGVADGTKVILWKWNAGSNQQWLMTPI